MDSITQVNEAIATLLAVILGWGLSELSQALRSRGTARVAVGRALREVLDVHHMLRTTELTRAELQRRLGSFPIPRHALFAAVRKVLPEDGDRVNRFSQALQDIAGVDPTLAFRLSSLVHLPAFLSGISAAEAGDQLEFPNLEPAADKIAPDLIEVLEEAARRLAWRHGWTTWWSVRRWLRSNVEVPPEVEQFLDLVLEAPGTAAGGSATLNTTATELPVNSDPLISANDRASSVEGRKGVL